MYYYSPSNLQIDIGQTVQWNNLAGFHDVVVTNGPEILSLPAVSGPALIGTLTFNTVGIYDYICSIGSHAQQGMVGTVTVGLGGCLDVNACNYNASVDFDNGSCAYAETNFNCAGECVVDVDCDGVCGGSAVNDECGVCGGDGVDADNDGVCDDVDDCVVQDGASQECGCNTGIADGACDCDGNVDLGCGCGVAGPSGCDNACGSTAEIDECGVCDGSGPGVECWNGELACSESSCSEVPANYPLSWDSDFDGIFDFVSSYEFNGSVTISVRDADDLDVVSSGDLLAAFDSNGTIRGFSNAAFNAPLGQGYIFNMMLYSNEASETLSFSYYDSDVDEILEVGTTITFVSDMIEGDVFNPFIVNLSSGSVQLSIDLDSGWNWISIPAENEGQMNVNSVFAQYTVGADGSGPEMCGDEWCPNYIKGQENFGTFYSQIPGFYPAFIVSPLEMYKYKMNGSTTFNYEGAPIPLDTEINLDSGWNWISYLPNTSISASVALASAIFYTESECIDAGHSWNGSACSNVKTTLNYLKGQESFGAYYYQIPGFYPAVVMNYTEGYALKMNSVDVLNYSVGVDLNNGGLARYDVISENEILDNIQIENFEHNGSITATVNINEATLSENDMLYAYHNNELRGAVKADIFPVTGEIVFNLLAYGHGVANETLEFQFYDFEKEKYYVLDGTMSFEADMVVADALNPYLFDQIDNNNMIVSDFELISTYPNPFNPVTNINYIVNEASDISISVFDLLGRKIQTLDNGFKHSGEYQLSWDASYLSSGIYYIQISNENQLINQKVTLLK